MPILGSQSSGAKGAPTAPTIGTVTLTNSTTASIPFTAPNSKLPITSYTTTSSPSISLSTSGTTSPLTVTGSFTAGQAYTFTITATNANGTSAASSASNSVTPVIPQGGFSAGGQTGSSRTSSIDKLTFSDDTRSTLSATLSAARESISGMANSGTAGYMSGGWTGSRSSGIDKLAFTSEARSTLGGTLSVANTNTTSMANSGTAGYVGGGSTGGTTCISTINKVTFSNDGVATIGSSISFGGSAKSAGFANSGTAGYFAGGILSGLATQSSEICKLTFSNDSTATLAATLTTVNEGPSGMANSGTAGYISGGANGGSVLSRIDKLTFSGDSKSTLSATLSSVRGEMPAAFAKSGTAGYVCGGAGSGGTPLSSINKITFSSDTRSTLGATLSNSVYLVAGFANSGTL